MCNTYRKRTGIRFSIRRQSAPFFYSYFSYISCPLGVPPMPARELECVCSVKGLDASSWPCPGFPRTPNCPSWTPSAWPPATFHTCRRSWWTRAMKIWARRRERSRHTSIWYVCHDQIFSRRHAIYILHVFYKGAWELASERGYADWRKGSNRL